MEKISNLAERDRKCIWHPFKQMQTDPYSIPIVKAEGVYLYTENGERYIDGISSWWINLHGHSHPYIVEKISKQLHLLEQVNFGDFTHAPAIELAERLLNLLPTGFSKVFYTDNGSTAIEVALKMVIQYWHNQNPTTARKKVISFRGGYHGDTFGAMSAAGKSTFTHPFRPYLFEVESIDPPWKGKEKESLQQLKNILEEGASACFIFEPLLLGVGGMLSYPPEGLDALISLCKQYGVLTIADEILTGFGRIGPLFACELLQQIPDIICLSKGLTGGFLPLGATLCKEEIYRGFLSNELSKALLHGHTYTANPLACTAALANLDLLALPDSITQREMVHRSHQKFCAQIKQHPLLLRCEVIGTILVLEYRTPSEVSYFNPLRDRLSVFFHKHKISLRPMGNIVYVMPPYCIEPQTLDKIYEVLLLSLEHPL